MSGTAGTPGAETDGDRARDGPVVVRATPRVRVLLDRLADRRCRAVLAATTDAARSAREVATRCDLPLSTTYRKLDHLVEAGLLTERTRVRCAGKHPSEFRRAADEVVVDVRPSGKTHLVVMDRSPGQ